MKKCFRRCAALLLSAVLLLGASVTALAEEGETAGKTGTITIQGAIEGVDYSIYRIFDLESFSVPEGREEGSYSYKLSEKWKDFPAGEYFTVNENGYIDWTAENDPETAKAFSKEAFAFAKEAGIAADAVMQAEPDGEGKSASAVFQNIPLGYYLVDSTVGALLSLDTARPDVTIEEKNEAPTIEKTVRGEDGNYGEKNTASVGDTVEFKIVIEPKPGADRYVLHDTMSEGLDFTGVTEIVLKAGDTVLKQLEEGDDYELYRNSAQNGDGCTFEIAFQNSVFGQLTEKEAGYRLEIAYEAVLNEKAVVDGEGNKNTAQLSYGDKHKTTETETTTYSFDIGILKYTAEGEGKKPLAGAQFSLYPDKACAEGTEIAFQEQEKAPDYEGRIYRKTQAAEGGATVITTDATGRFRLEGLKAGTYYLKEIKAPDGYNRLKAPVEVEVTGEFDGDANGDQNGRPADEIQVENKSGTLLPETGGIGTNIFYGVGMLLMAGAGIVLIAGKKRRK